MISKLLFRMFLGFLLSGPGMAADVSTASDPAPSAGNTQPISPSHQYVTAYDSMMQADWLKKQDMTDTAIELYAEAQNLYQKLAAEYPLWETNVVAFRIKYCADELAKLRPAPPAPAETRAAAEPPPIQPPRELFIPSPAGSPAPADAARVSANLRAALQKERAGDVKSALETYLTILEEQPLSRDAIKGAGRCYLYLSMPENARILLQRGMELPDPDAALNLLMALVYCHDSEFYKAYQLLLIVLHQQPMNATAHLAMGVAQAGRNRLDDARVETQKAIQLDPKLGDAYYNLARLSLKLKPSSPAIARGHYENALRYGGVPDPDLKKQLR
ncbi:MAG: hypothetical protein KKG09_08805 [Verrucomicrobia bacterium]|nr:hypothetical protein [Verrucomicrobiota bacterium]MBU4246957.1 hypothetical protein [Verrucomicrobiota bacterium]MBU4291335.1 hypothetical protein [Verrucomicrobiota bacterium]MBU4498088.1 hypothetical protein [Verrucomicrobiota bacterium]MCG2680037.1 hypothetical protein [Kiritimatiellia bacterium]